MEFFVRDKSNLGYFIQVQNNIIHAEQQIELGVTAALENRINEVFVQKIDGLISITFNNLKVFVYRMRFRSLFKQTSSTRNATFIYQMQTKSIKHYYMAVIALSCIG